MKILIITYNWLPRNAMGTHRVVSFANEWSLMGNDVSVVTSRKSAFDQPLDLKLPVESEISVIQIEANITSGWLASIVPSFLLETLKKIRRYIYKLLNIISDPRDGFLSNFIEKNKHTSFNYDVIVSSHGPSSCHKIASYIKTRNPKIFWVADYRDLWSQNENDIYSNKQRSLLEIDELETLQNSDLITTVSNGFRNQLGKLFYNKKIIIIPNGHDRYSSDVEENLNSSKQIGREISISFTGNYYKDSQNIKPFLRALKKFNKDHQDIRLKLYVYGNRIKEIERLADREKIIDRQVFIMGHVNREQILNIQKDSDLLLNLENNIQDSGAIPGKIYEYICSGTPIITIGGEENSEIKDVLARTKSGISFGSTSQDIYNHFKKFVKNKKDLFNPDINAIMLESRKNHATKLLSEINNMISKD